MQTIFDWTFDNSYARLPDTLFSRVTPSPISNPRLVIRSTDCAQLLEISDSTDESLAAYFSGEALLDGMQPLAQKYTGHQFGAYNPELGDGRGLLLGEIVTRNKQRWDLHLKGAGLTPYSRMGDGRAVLRSSIREFLASEALFHLHIPTTRALCVISSDEPVYRETQETAATLLRVAQTHLRFGHFEYLFHSNKKDALRSLIDYTIEHHYPECAKQSDPVQSLFRAVVHRTATMIAHWQAVGFAHGVMNTDNFSIVGDTFDFGPYAFMDSFNPALICNHSDWQGRYAFNKQPQIGLWNLNCLAMTFSDYLSREQLISALQEYDDVFHQHYMTLLGKKIGIAQAQEKDAELIGNLLSLMAKTGADYSRTFRFLADLDVEKRTSRARDEFNDVDAFDQWCETYIDRMSDEDISADARVALMNQSNPKFILRNYLAQQAIADAEQGDYAEVRRLHTLLCHPFDEQPEFGHYADLPPDWGRHMEISCSS
ncbi:MAG: YdiU family protein [Alcanivoracaceae bacterium]|nr:YdiU family protein [Alcanivoracaceae bacterium]